MVRGKQGHAQCKISSSKYHHVNYCGHQLARRLGRVAPANHKMEGATPHPGAYKYSLQYDRRLDECIGVQVRRGN